MQTHKPKPIKIYRTRNHIIEAKDKKEKICQNKALLEKCWTFAARNWVCC